MSKEKAAAGTNKKKKMAETEKQNKTEEDEKQTFVAGSTQSSSSEDGQMLKEEEKPTKDGLVKTVEEKREDHQMEVDACPESAASGDEKGKSEPDK